MACCQYLFQLWGLGYSRSFLRGAVSAMRALQEMGWLPKFLRAGLGDVQNGPRLRRSRALTQDCRRSQISQGRVMAGRSGRYTEWQSHRSHACYGWARQPPSRVEGPAGGCCGFTPSSVTHTLSEGGWGATARRGCDGYTVRGPPSAIPLAHFCPQGSAYLQMVMATALSGCECAPPRWHAWGRGGSAALRWLGLPF